MKSLLRAVVVGSVISLALATMAQAAEKAAATATATYKVGDKVRICGCGKTCTCNSIQAAAGKCHCGKDLIEATVTKVEGERVTVKSAQGEQVITLKKA